MILQKAVDVNTIYMMSFYAEKEHEALRLMQEKHGMKVTNLPEANGFLKGKYRANF